MLPVCVLVCSVLALSVCAQDEIGAATEMTEAVTEVPVYVSDAICRECNCSGTTADCRKRELRRLFDVDDWIGLRYLNITEVDLSENHFISVAQFPEIPLKKLNLSSCEIEILEEATFSNLKDLTALDLSRNKISTASIGKREFLGILQEGRKPLPFVNLRHLSLAYNDIHSLSQDIFTFIPRLTFLDLSGNPLNFIDQITMGALTDLTRLKELRISECDLEILPEGLFRRQRRLERLDLSGNRFTTVPAVLSEAVNLQYLNFNRNPIQNLSERTAISNLIYLQELHLSRHSNLRTIAAGALGGLPNLVVLHMKYNPRLTDLDPAFLKWEDDVGIERWPQLKELYLNNNNLSSIDSNMLDHWSQLSEADFSANPYSCDCSCQWMVDVLVPHLLQTTSNVTTTKMVCRRPEEYRGMTFAQLYEGEKKLMCSPSESLIDDSASEMAIMYGILVGRRCCPSPGIFPSVASYDVPWEEWEWCYSNARHHTFMILQHGHVDLMLQPAAGSTSQLMSSLFIILAYVSIFMYCLIGILVTFPIVLLVVILWRNGYFARCRRKMNSQKENFYEEETDAL